MSMDGVESVRLFTFDNSYATELPGFYAPWKGAQAPDPRVVQLNAVLATELGLDPAALATPRGAAVLAGSEVPEGAFPLAQAYAGHQFGRFVPQLGDGRALLIGELIDDQGVRRDVQLKGSGRTPFSRGGDGKAVLGPVLREYLIGEAMHALGIPTTRALAAVTTGEPVMRQGPEPGAVLARVASSHLRVGTFQFFAARGDTDKVRQLADYAMRRHFPELVEADDRYVEFLRAVGHRQATLIAHWMSVGFVHGVMNTDNMTISGETLDYGPCAFLDHFDPGAVFSSIDHQGRYAYANQPTIARWNLARLAETLLPLFEEGDQEPVIARLTEVVEGFAGRYQIAWLEATRRKLGLCHGEGVALAGPAAQAKEAGADQALVDDLLALMYTHKVDFTQLFRALADALRGNRGRLDSLVEDRSVWDAWLARWRERAASGGVAAAEVADGMDRVNPVYIPRNHKVEEALQAASRDSNFTPFQRLLGVLQDPFERRPGLESYEGPAPEHFGPYVTFCGT
jgi:uncharacterized protein YdiU (UPF0061 family)